MKVVNDVHFLPDGAWVLPTTAHSGAKDREIALGSGEGLGFTFGFTSGLSP